MATTHRWREAHRGDYANGLWQCRLGEKSAKDMTRYELIAFIGNLDTMWTYVARKYAKKFKRNLFEDARKKW